VQAQTGLRLSRQRGAAVALSLIPVPMRALSECRELKEFPKAHAIYDSPATAKELVTFIGIPSIGDFWALRRSWISPSTMGETFSASSRERVGQEHSAPSLVAGILQPSQGSFWSRDAVSRCSSWAPGFNPEVSGRDNVLS